MRARALRCAASPRPVTAGVYEFRIWEPERFRAHLDEARNLVREMRKELGATHAASAPRPYGARE